MKPWIKFNNAQACLDWIRYMTDQLQAGPLIGEVGQQLLEILGAYETQSCHQEYGAEIPLLGEAGMDMSIQYDSIGFLAGNSIVNDRLKRAGEIFHQYVQCVAEQASHILEKSCLYLEADTQSGSTERVAYFYPMTRGTTPVLLPKAMELAGQPHRTAQIAKYLSAIPELHIRHLGIMESRQENYIRLTLLDLDENIDLFMAGARKLCSPEFVADVENLLREISKLDLFRFTLNADVMPDGSIGDVFGVELLMKEIYPTRRKRLMASDEFAQFIELLKKNNMADDRADLLYRCVFSEKMTGPMDYPYYMDSRISHFKIRWKKGRFMPAKVYLQLKTEPVQRNINESVELMKK